MSESAIQHSEQDDDDDEDLYTDSSEEEDSSDDDEQIGSNHFADAIVDLPIPYALKQFILYYRTHLPPNWNDKRHITTTTTFTV